MSEPIVLYDIPSQNPGKAWSHNIWKIRYALKYKGLPFRTEWVEYPDIEALCKEIGAPPTEKKADGRDHYTLPVIFDPSTKKVVADSKHIAKYLDVTYPHTPQLFPPGTDAFQAAFLSIALPQLSVPTRQILLDRIAISLNPRSSVYFRKTREEKFGPLKDTNTPQAWEAIEKGLGQIKTFLEANGEGRSLTFSGEKDKFTFSDLQLACTLVWVRVIVGKDSEDWKKFTGFHDGFGAKLFAQFEKYSEIEE